MNEDHFLYAENLNIISKKITHPANYSEIQWNLRNKKRKEKLLNVYTMSGILLYSIIATLLGIGCLLGFNNALGMFEQIELDVSFIIRVIITVFLSLFTGYMSFFIFKIIMKIMVKVNIEIEQETGNSYLELIKHGKIVVGKIQEIKSSTIYYSFVRDGKYISHRTENCTDHYQTLLFSRYQIGDTVVVMYSNEISTLL